MSSFKLMGAAVAVLATMGCSAMPAVMPQAQSVLPPTSQVAAAATEKVNRFAGQIYALRTGADGKTDTKLIAVHQKGLIFNDDALFVITPKTEVLLFDGQTHVPLQTTGIPLMSAMAVAIETAAPIRKLGRKDSFPVQNDQARQAETTANQAVKVVVMKNPALLKTYKLN